MPTAFRFCMDAVRQQRAGLGVLLIKRELYYVHSRRVSKGSGLKEAEMSLYPLVISIAVLALFVVMSVMPVLFSDKDLDSLVFL